MPADQANDRNARQWLARAISSLELAKVPKPEKTAWEDLCFSAQQAAEKALQAMFIRNGLSFRYIHNIGELLTALDAAELRFRKNYEMSLRSRNMPCRCAIRGFMNTLTAMSMKRPCAWPQ